MSLTISLTPAQVEQRLTALRVTCHFSSAELLAFQTTPVVSRPEALIGFPTPKENTELTLRKLKAAVGVDPKRQPSFFDHPWYETEAFMDTPCPPGWHFLTSEPLPGSIQQPLSYLRSLGTGAQLELPLAIEVVLMLFLHYEGTREQLLLKKHTWCSDVASLDRHVTVGAFGRNGVFLSGHPENFASQGLGICPRIQAP